MGCHKNGCLMISLICLLISSLTHVRFIVEGRAISKLHELDFAKKEGEEEVEVEVVERRLIGSRPPRCERKCSTCGHCEAVQVPINVPKKQLKSLITRSHHLSRLPRIAYSRGDDISNYKPMCWKCKCGDFFFNPF